MQRKTILLSSFPDGDPFALRVGLWWAVLWLCNCNHHNYHVAVEAGVEWRLESASCVVSITSFVVNGPRSY